jgi:hypothetical protein
MNAIVTVVGARRVLANRALAVRVRAADAWKFLGYQRT